MPLGGCLTLSVRCGEASAQLSFGSQPGGGQCEPRTLTKCHAFERSSKRRKGYPLETRVKRGERVVHGR
jgi:hypothetical protein